MKCQEDGEGAGVQPMLNCDFYLNIFSFQTRRLLKCYVNFSFFNTFTILYIQTFDNGNSSDSVNGPREVKVQRKCRSY